MGINCRKLNISQSVKTHWETDQGQEKDTDVQTHVTWQRYYFCVILIYFKVSQKRNYSWFCMWCDWHNNNMEHDCSMFCLLKFQVAYCRIQCKYKNEFIYQAEGRLTQVFQVKAGLDLVPKWPYFLHWSSLTKGLVCVITGETKCPVHLSSYTES